MPSMPRLSRSSRRLSHVACSSSRTRSARATAARKEIRANRNGILATLRRDVRGGREKPSPGGPASLTDLRAGLTPDHKFAGPDRPIVSPLWERRTCGEGERPCLSVKPPVASTVY